MYASGINIPNGKRMMCFDETGMIRRCGDGMFYKIVDKVAKGQGKAAKAKATGKGKAKKPKAKGKAKPSSEKVLKMAADMGLNTTRYAWNVPGALPMKNRMPRIRAQVTRAPRTALTAKIREALKGKVYNKSAYKVSGKTMNNLKTLLRNAKALPKKAAKKAKAVPRITGEAMAEGYRKALAAWNKSKKFRVAKGYKAPMLMNKPFYNSYPQM